MRGTPSSCLARFVMFVFVILMIVIVMIVNVMIVIIMVVIVMVVIVMVVIVMIAIVMIVIVIVINEGDTIVLPLSVSSPFVTLLVSISQSSSLMQRKRFCLIYLQCRQCCHHQIIYQGVQNHATINFGFTHQTLVQLLE